MEDHFALVKKWLDDIEFLNHNEVIILWLGHVNNCDDGSSGSQPCVSDWEKCLTDSGLDNYVIQNDGCPPFSRTLEDLTKDNKHVILMINNYTIISNGEEVVFGPNWFPCTDNVDHSYSDGITPNEADLYNNWYYDQMHRDIQPPTLGVLGCEKYFGDSDYIQCVKQGSSIYGLAFMEASYCSLFDYINIVQMYGSQFEETRRSYMVDLYSPMATQLAISLNYDIAINMTYYHGITHPIFSKNVVSVYKGASGYYYFMNVGDSNIPKYKVFNKSNGEIADGVVNWNGTITFNWGSNHNSWTGAITYLSDFGVPSSIQMTVPGDTINLQGTPEKDPATGNIIFKSFDGVEVPDIDPVTGKISWNT